MDGSDAKENLNILFFKYDFDAEYLQLNIK